MFTPSGCVIYPAAAVKLKLVPLIPGTAACAVPESNKASAATTRGSRPVTRFCFFMFVFLIAALLVGDHDFGHKASEVLGVVREVIEVGCVQEISAGGNTGGIKDRIERFAATEGDGVGSYEEIVPCLIAQQLCVEANNRHRDTERLQGLILSHVEVGNAQQRSARCAACTRRAQRDQGGEGLRWPRKTIG